MAIALLVIIVLIALYGFGALFYASSRITREPVQGLGRGGVYHVLVTGSDSRENLSRRERNELHTGHAAGGDRTDTIFVLSVRGTRAAMLAFPRDLFVTRCDGSEGRINAATSIGGQSCLVETVSDLSGLPIRHAVQIDFAGFRDVVNAVDGVELCLDDPIADSDAGIDLPAGCQTLRGADALGYVRVRKIDNDLERIKRQQQFLKALASEIAQPATVLNPFRFYGVAGATGGALRADDDLSSVDLVRLGLGARGIANGRIATETVPSTPATIGGAAVLQVEQAAAEAVFERFRSGNIFGEITDVDTTVAPEDVELVVLNGSGVEGLAGETAEQLEARGFVVRNVGNAPATNRTVVRYPEGQEAKARTVAAQVPGGGVEVEQDTSVDIVTLVLGSGQ
jgi:LCP family protein required for cell wall assembly